FTRGSDRIGAQVRRQPREARIDSGSPRGGLRRVAVVAGLDIQFAHGRIFRIRRLAWIARQGPDVECAPHTAKPTVASGRVDNMGDARRAALPYEGSADLSEGA